MHNWYSPGYLAGVGAASLGLAQCDNPFGYADEGFPDFLNGFGDTPDKNANDVDDEDEAGWTEELEKLQDAVADARIELAKVLVDDFDPENMDTPPLKDLVKQAVERIKAMGAVTAARRGDA